MQTTIVSLAFFLFHFIRLSSPHGFPMPLRTQAQFLSPGSNWSPPSYAGIDWDIAAKRRSDSGVYQRCKATHRCNMAQSSYDTKKAKFEYTKSFFLNGVRDAANTFLDFENWEAGTTGISANSAYLKGHTISTRGSHFNSFWPELDAVLHPRLFLNHSCTVILDSDELSASVTCEPVPSLPVLNRTLLVNDTRLFSHFTGAAGQYPGFNITIVNGTSVNVSIAHPLWSWLAEYVPSPSVRDMNVTVNCSWSADEKSKRNTGDARGGWRSFPLPESFSSKSSSARGGLELDDEYYAEGTDPYGSAFDSATDIPRGAYRSDGPSSLYFVNGIYHPDGSSSPGWADAKKLWGCPESQGYSYSRNYTGVLLYTRNGAGRAGALKNNISWSDSTAPSWARGSRYFGGGGPSRPTSIPTNSYPTSRSKGRPSDEASSVIGIPVVVFHFESIFLGPSVKILTRGALPIALYSRSSLVIDTPIDVVPGTLGGFPGSRGTLTTHTNTIGPGSSTTRTYSYTVTIGARIIPEIQEVTTKVDYGQTLRGTWFLSLRGESTPNIPAEAEPATVASLMMKSLRHAGTVTVSRSNKLAQGGYKWSITFDTVAGDVPQMTIGSKLQGLGADIKIETLRDGNQIRGNFSLSFRGKPLLKPLLVNATSEEVKDAMELSWGGEQGVGLLHAHVSRSDPGTLGQRNDNVDSPTTGISTSYDCVTNARYKRIGPGPAYEVFNPTSLDGDILGSTLLAKSPRRQGGAFEDFGASELPSSTWLRRKLAILTSEPEPAQAADSDGRGPGSSAGLGSHSRGGSHCVNGPGPGWGLVWSITLTTHVGVVEDVFPTSPALISEWYTVRLRESNLTNNAFGLPNTPLARNSSTWPYNETKSARESAADAARERMCLGLSPWPLSIVNISAGFEHYVNYTLPPAKFCMRTPLIGPLPYPVAIDPLQKWSAPLAFPLLSGVIGGRHIIAAASTRIPDLIRSSQSALSAFPPDLLIADGNGLTGTGAFVNITVGHWSSEATALSGHAWLRPGDSYTGSTKEIEESIINNRTLWDSSFDSLYSATGRAPYRPSGVPAQSFSSGLPGPGLGDPYEEALEALYFLQSAGSETAMNLSLSGSSTTDPSGFPSTSISDAGRILPFPSFFDTSAWLVTSSIGGAGASHGGIGGIGHARHGPRNPVGDAGQPDLLGGSGGAAGSANLQELLSHSKDPNGAGGAGGGAIELSAVTDLVIGRHSRISANAGSGENGYRGGGGGAGGSIVLSAGQTIVLRGNLEATGGDGGTGTGTGSRGGGGGSGGRIAAFAQSIATLESGESAATAHGGRGGWDEADVLAKKLKPDFAAVLAVDVSLDLPTPSVSVTKHSSYNGVLRTSRDEIDGGAGTVALLSGSGAAFHIETRGGGAEDTRKCLRVSTDWPATQWPGAGQDPFGAGGLGRANPSASPFTQNGLLSFSSISGVNRKASAGVPSPGDLPHFWSSTQNAPRAHDGPWIFLTPKESNGTFWLRRGLPSSITRHVVGVTRNVTEEAMQAAARAALQAALDQAAALANATNVTNATIVIPPCKERPIIFTDSSGFSFIQSTIQPPDGSVTNYFSSDDYLLFFIALDYIGMQWYNTTFGITDTTVFCEESVVSNSTNSSIIVEIPITNSTNSSEIEPPYVHEVENVGTKGPFDWSKPRPERVTVYVKVGHWPERSGTTVSRWGFQIALHDDSWERWPTESASDKKAIDATRRAAQLSAEAQALILSGATTFDPATNNHSVVYPTLSSILQREGNWIPDLRYPDPPAGILASSRGRTGSATTSTAAATLLASSGAGRPGSGKRGTFLRDAGDPSSLRLEDFWPSVDGYWYNDFEAFLDSNGTQPRSISDPARLIHKQGLGNITRQDLSLVNQSIGAWIITGGNGPGGLGGPEGVGLLPFDPSSPSIVSPAFTNDAGADGVSPAGDASVMIGVGSLNGRWVHDSNYRHSPGLAFSRGSSQAAGAFDPAGTTSAGPQPDRWYKIDMFIDWHNHTYKVRLDDVTVAIDMPFKGEGVTRIGLYVFDRSTAWFDEIYAGQDDTLAFECPHTSNERDALSIRRPVQSSWEADEVGPDDVYWPKSKHESHLSKRETFTNPYHAGLIDGDGSPHRWYFSDVGPRAGQNKVTGEPPLNRASQLELPGEVVAGALLSVRGDQPSPTLLEASQTISALVDTNRAQLPQAYVSSSEPYAPTSTFPSRVPLYSPSRRKGVELFEGKEEGLGLGAESGSGWPPFGEFFGPTERYDSISDPLIETDKAEWSWNGDLWQSEIVAKSDGPFASSRAGIPPFGEWTGGESIRIGNTAERGPEGGYRGATGRTYWYGEHDYHRYWIFAYDSLSKSGWNIPPWFVEGRPWYAGGVGACSSSDLANGGWRNEGIVFHYVNISNTNNYTRGEYRGDRLNNTVPSTHFYGQPIKKGGKESYNAQHEYSYRERDWFSWRNYSYSPYPHLRSVNEEQQPHLIHEPPTDDFAKFYWGGPGISERSDPDPYRCERPKVVHNLNSATSSKTGQVQKRAVFVMWMAADDYIQSRLLAGVAVSDFPGGPFVFVHSMRPDTNETIDFTVMQDADSGDAFLVRSYYITTSFWLPEPIMQPIWESVKDIDADSCTQINNVDVCTTNHGLTYHRAFYDSGYDDPNDIWLQKWRLEDKPWNISIYKDRFDSTINWNRRETFDITTGNYTMSHFFTCGVDCDCGGLDCTECCDPSNQGVYFEVPLVQYPPTLRLFYTALYFDKYSIRTVTGQGAGGVEGVVTSRFIDPAFPENSKWMPNSVPAVKAQPWQANYREKNIVDNPLIPTVPDLLIGPNNIVEQRRAKYIAISRLTDDYLNTTGTLIVLEGSTEGDDRLINVMSEFGRFGWSVGKGKATGFPGSITPSGDALQGPSETGQTTYQPDVYGRVYPFGFDVQSDWDTRHWQYNQTYNDRELDFRNFRDRITSSRCQDLHHLVLIKLAECQAIMNHELTYVLSPPQKSDGEIDVSYSSVMDSTRYTDCLSELRGSYNSYNVYQTGIQQLYQDCIRSYVPKLEDLPDYSIGERTCIGGGGVCGPPIRSTEDGELPNVSYGFPPFDPVKAIERIADIKSPLGKPFFQNGLDIGAFEPDLTAIFQRSWKNHTPTELDIGRASRGMSTSVPSYYETALGGLFNDTGGEPNYYSTRTWEIKSRAEFKKKKDDLLYATKTATATPTASGTTSATATQTKSSRPSRSATRSAPPTLTPTATQTSGIPSITPTPSKTRSV